MKNTHLQIKSEQVETLINLVNEEIRAKRVYLRASNKVSAPYYIRSITQFRHLRQTLENQERANMMQENIINSMEAEERADLIEKFGTVINRR